VIACAICGRPLEGRREGTRTCDARCRKRLSRQKHVQRAEVAPVSVTTAKGRVWQGGTRDAA
jgi:hypothetical protein